MRRTERTGGEDAVAREAAACALEEEFTANRRAEAHHRLRNDQMRRSTAAVAVQALRKQAETAAEDVAASLHLEANRLMNENGLTFADFPPAEPA